ncbi:MAG: GGDEF domain-containing protein [Deltaproteobacteria bacterium]|nr:GGDEF domain-containing protein [Deltaproteobacteria bacterium]MCL5276434.1 GGDEF domain-containing protein [Deltaproteobacteria bacterium]
MTDDKTSFINIDLNELQGERHKSCIIIEGEQIGRIFYLTKQSNVIGRSEDADINLDSPTVSRRHAVISLGREGRIFIKDLGSSNGTYVNARRIAEAELGEGDIFAVGVYKLKVAALSRHDTAFFQHMVDGAERDSLTGAYNKGFITKLLDTVIARSRHLERPISIAMVDIDHFKSVNDTYGHMAGDAVLKNIAVLFDTSLRSTDRFGRFGGEEFLIIFDRTSMGDAKVISERIRRAVMERPAVYSGRRIEVTISVGLACNEGGHIVDAESFIRAADEKLYAAKRNGRNQTVS